MTLHVAAAELALEDVVVRPAVEVDRLIRPAVILAIHHGIALEAERRDHRRVDRMLADAGERGVARDVLGAAPIDGDDVHAGHDAGTSQASAQRLPQSAARRPSGRRTEAWVEPPAGMTSP